MSKERQRFRHRTPSSVNPFINPVSVSSIKGEKEEVAVAGYIAKFPPKPSLTTLKGNIKRGRELYLKCAGCHSPEGEGKKEVIPHGFRIQENWFLLDQLRKYCHGFRGHHFEDANGRAMAESIRNWPDRELQDAAVYISSR